MELTEECTGVGEDVKAVGNAKKEGKGALIIPQSGTAVHTESVALEENHLAAYLSVSSGEGKEDTVQVPTRKLEEMEEEKNELKNKFSKLYNDFLYKSTQMRDMDSTQSRKEQTRKLAAGNESLRTRNGR